MSGQVWALDQINGSLFCGNDNGCYLDGNHVLFNGLDGFFVLNSNYKDQSQERPTYIRSITGTNHADTLLYLSLKPTDDEGIRIAKAENSIRIEFIQTEYRSAQAVSYSCLLEGYDRDWSQPQLQTSKEYTKLPKGQYTFRLRAFNRLTGKTDEVAFRIEILPAWYETWWAYIIYLLLAAAAVWAFAKWLKRRQDRKLNELRAQKEQEIRHDIQANINEDDGWDRFEQNFNLVYDNYMKRLTARYRLRKKLGMEQGDNLVHPILRGIKKKGGSWMQEPPSFLPFYFFTFLLFTAAACRYRPGYRRRHRARGR